MSGKLSTVQMGQLLEELAEETEWERCAHLSHEEVLAEARAVGVDVDAAILLGKELAELAAAADDPPPPPVPSLAEVRRAERPPIPRWGIALGLGVAALGGLTLTWSAVLRPRTSHGARTAAEEAHDLRTQADRAMERGEWARAIELLDQARGLDPEGDRMPGIQQARRIAKDTLAAIPDDAGDKRPSSD